jgi:hypothetical protein
VKAARSSESIGTLHQSCELVEGLQSKVTRLAEPPFSSSSGILGKREPHGLSARGRLDAPSVRHRFDDAEPSSRAIGWRGGLELRSAPAGVAHFYTDWALPVVDRELEGGLCVLDAVSGQLAGHQLRGIQGVA